ncbi:RHS repeat-associated protein [Luteimonas cucumeris]|uniref:RHS repeat-associated protein n=1 Tax=Luteimonas cucumeris TaxID=985012 RepID=A0A562L7Z4_9GAMM|nr:RHS repeat-associated core domain-containing protein [Luteimonas cucumeris]TWI03646.1 RHS repeat-associated protein [Luteimonas cucumeris]
MTMNCTFARCFSQTIMALFGLLLGIGTAHAAETVTYYHTDALGTPVMESNAVGTVTYAREHKPYGEQALGAAKNGPGFTGHMGDTDTGLTYMQQRYYDPASGRFLSNDPVGIDLNNGANYNRYWYANNNPYRFTDPDGRRSKEESDYKREQAEERRRAEEESRRKAEEAKRQEQAQRAQQAGEIAVGAMVTALMTLPDVMSPDGGGSGFSSLITGLLFKTENSITAEVASATSVIKRAPRPALNFKPPTNSPQNPPQIIPAGYGLRVMAPTEQYKNGYWVLEKPMSNGGLQKINPSTGRPGPEWDTHVPLPPAGG